MTAVTVPQPGQVLEFAMLQQHCRKHLAGFKLPRELHVVDELPRNPSEKVLKRDLRKTFGSKA